MKVIDKKFWKNKNVLITGFEGFLGSNLVKAILEREARVIGLDIKTFRKETILCSQDYKKMVIYKGSVTNFKLLMDILHKHSINVIFHLAAEAIVGRCQVSPLKTFKSNIVGTWEVLEAARLQGNVQAIVVASSDKAYGSHKKLPYTENAPLVGRHPYDVSKSCADLIASTYFHTYDLSVAVTRCGNIYGPGDFNFSRIIPDTIHSALTGKKLFIRSDGKFTRDYIYIDDIINGYLLLAQNLKKLNLAGEAFNFSDENPIRVIKLVNEIFKICRKKPNYRILNEAKYEIEDQYLSSKKVRKTISWKPRYSLEKGLQKTIAWYSSNL